MTDDGQCDPRNRQRDEENSRARKNPLAVPPAQQPETGLRVLARFDGRAPTRTRPRFATDVALAGIERSGREAPAGDTIDP